MVGCGVVPSLFGVDGCAVGVLDCGWSEYGGDFGLCVVCECVACEGGVGVFADYVVVEFGGFGVGVVVSVL